MPRWTPFEPYFWSLVDKSGECWLWLGGRYSDGYGRVHYKGRRHPAHRVSCELSGRPIPDDLHGCHECDNKLCVRPDHIFPGTQADNMQDWTKKGKNKLVQNPIRGDDHYMRRLISARCRMGDARRAEFASGKREIVRGEDGRIIGTKMK